MDRALDIVAHVSMTLGVLTLTGAGLAWVLGLGRLRDRLVRVTAALVVIALVVPGLVRWCVRRFEGLRTPDGLVLLPAVSASLCIGITVGHLVLVVVLLRRRLRGPDAARRDVQERERVRGRERVRLPPRIEGGEP